MVSVTVIFTVINMKRFYVNIIVDILQNGVFLKTIKTVNVFYNTVFGFP